MKPTFVEFGNQIVNTTSAPIAVTVTNTDRNVVMRTVKSDDQGTYVAPLLPVGRYSVSVAAPGFKTFTAKELQLNVSDRLAVNATLSAGQYLSRS